MKYMFCGSQEEPRDYQGYYPAPEPSAPPAYSYNTNSYGRNVSMLYPMDDIHNKNGYDQEMEHLDTRSRGLVVFSNEWLLWISWKITQTVAKETYYRYS